MRNLCLLWFLPFRRALHPALPVHVAAPHEQPPIFSDRSGVRAASRDLYRDIYRLLSTPPRDMAAHQTTTFNIFMIMIYIAAFSVMIFNA